MARSSSSDRASRFAAIRAASTFAGLDRGGLGIFLVRFVSNGPEKISSQQAGSVGWIVWIRITSEDRKKARIWRSRAMMTVHAVANDALAKSGFEPGIKCDVRLSVGFLGQVEIIARAHQVVSPHPLDLVSSVGRERARIRAVVPPKRSPNPVIDFLGRQMGAG